MGVGKYLGRNFEHGIQDCYSLIRDFYKDTYNIELKNYARPNDWWALDFDLYRRLALKEGFVFVQDNKLQEGDIILMAIRSTVPCHGAIYINPGKILHHFYGRRSNLENYAGVWYNSTTAVIRHPKVPYSADVIRMELKDDPAFQASLHAVMGG